MHPSTNPAGPTQAELDKMHDVYRKGGEDRAVAPHVVYSDPNCPYPDCGHHLQAIDFCLERHGKDVHDPLVRAWWADIGFAGRCPGCGRWIHFTIRSKRQLTDEEAAQLPQLPDGWENAATIL